MAKKIAPLLPSTDGLLHQLGERLSLARRRRRLSAKQVCERAGMSPMTLRSLERGGAGVTMGAYVAVMQVLGVEADLDLLVKEDSLGRELQDARLPATRQARSVGSASQGEFLRSTPCKPATSSEPFKKLPKSAGTGRDWKSKAGFTSSESLAELFDSLPPLAKNRAR